MAVRCDHRDDNQATAVFRRIIAEQRRLDLLVNNVWEGYQAKQRITKSGFRPPYGTLAARQTFFKE